MLDNLVDNAVHSASLQTGGKVSISTSQDDRFAQIDVRDNGPGLDTEALSRAMEPFFTTKDSGTGLGLSISFEIVQAHDGELHLSNGPNSGAVASVRLPLGLSQTKLDQAVPEGLEQIHG